MSRATFNEKHHQKNFIKPEGGDCIKALIFKKAFFFSLHKDHEGRGGQLLTTNALIFKTLIQFHCYFCATGETTRLPQILKKKTNHDPK